MKQFSKKWVMMAAAGMLAVTTLAGCSRSLDNEAAVAEVGEETISLGTANFYARIQQAQYETYYASMFGMTGEEMWEQVISDDQTYEDMSKESILTNLEDIYLMRQHAEEYDVALTEDETAAIEEAAKAFVEANEDADRKVVSGEEQYVKEYLELATIQTKMSEAMVADVDTEVSDEEAAQKSMQYVLFSYTTTDEDGNSATMTDEEKEALKATAQVFADKVAADEAKDIEAAAEEAGQTVQTATFDSESTSPASEVIAAVDALENEGDVTGIIETDSGIYVAKLTSLLDRDATDSEKETIVSQRKQNQYDSLIEQWREDTEITEHKKVWKKISFIKQGVTVKDTTEEEESAE